MPGRSAVVIVSEIVFLILIGITSVYYYHIGQWKWYVRLFGIAEIFALSVTLLLFVLGKSIKHGGKGPLFTFALIVFAHGILCIMQLFPMVGAFIYSSYICNAAVHLVIIILGTFNTAALIRSHRSTSR